MATAKSITAKKPAVTKPASKPATKKTTAATTTMVAAKKPATVKKAATATAKPAAPAAVKKPAAVAKSAPAKASSTPTPEQRYRMVQDAAYFIAERNGFKAGSMDYWIAAEIEIEAVLSGKSKK